MKELNLKSPKFQRVIKNLELENLSLDPALQKKAIDIVNSNTEVTATLLKDALNFGKVQ